MATTKIAAAKADNTKDDMAPERKPPVIASGAVALDRHGHKSQRYFVRLPPDAILDDLKEPSIWSRVQQSGNVALRRFDDLVMIAYDESWMAEAVVTDATSTAARLSKPRVTELTQRLSTPFEDGDYRLRWNGDGFVVERKKDAHVVAGPFGSEGEARNALFKLYGKPA